MPFSKQYMKTNKGTIPVIGISTEGLLSEYNALTTSASERDDLLAAGLGSDPGSQAALDFAGATGSFYSGEMKVPIKVGASGTQVDEYTVELDGYNWYHYFLVEDITPGETYRFREGWRGNNGSVDHIQSFETTIWTERKVYENNFGEMPVGRYSAPGFYMFDCVNKTLPSIDVKIEGVTGDVISLPDIDNNSNRDNRPQVISDAGVTDEPNIGTDPGGGGGDGEYDNTAGAGPRVATTGNGFYALEATDVADLFANLNSKELSEALLELFAGKNYEGVLSLRFYPGANNESLSLSDTKRVIRIGNADLDKGVTARGYIIQDDKYNEIFKFTPFAKKHNNFLDSGAYTKCEIFIPFYGWYDLDPMLVYDQEITVQYWISVETGACSIEITNDGGFLDILPATFAVEIPVNATGSLTATALGLSAEARLVPAVIGAALTGAPGAVIGAGIGSMAAGTTFTANKTSAGQYGNNIGLLSPFGFFITKITTCKHAEVDPFYQGYPDGTRRKISECGNYIQGGNLQLGASVMPKYLEEINTMFANGVLVLDE